MLRFYKAARGCAGNALFIILIAIGLFAALNYAISHTSRGGTDNHTVRAIVGHEPDGVTEEVYTHGYDMKQIKAGIEAIQY